MKPKILFVVESMGGGVFTYIYSLANRLSNHYEIFIIYNTREETPTNYKKYFNESIKLIKLDSLTRKLSLFNDLRSLIKIRKIERCIKPNIIHLHSSKAGALGRMAFFGCNVPVFYTPHGYSFLMSNVSSFKRKIYYLIEYLLSKMGAITIACSKGEYDISLKFSRNSREIDNGIDIDDINVKSIDSQNITRKIYTLGRITNQKNPKLFNDIALRLPDSEFYWIGSGELENKLTAPNITKIAWLPKNAALKTANESDVFLLTSKWEGLSISLLESMYIKKLCVVSDIPENRCVITDGLNGYTCNTIDEYVKAINTSKSNYERCTLQAHEDVNNKYTLEYAAHLYSACYQASMLVNKFEKGQ